MPFFSKSQWDSFSADFARSLTMPLMRFCWGWAKKMVPLFVVLAIAFSLSVNLFHVFRGWRDNQIKIFVGPEGSSSSDQAAEVEAELKRTRSFWKPSYFVKQTLRTDGSVRILSRINEDTEGEVLGIANEGMVLGDTKNVCTLVPLEWSYLHFVVNTDSLEKELEVKLCGNRFQHVASGKTSQPGPPANLTPHAIEPYCFSEWSREVRRKLKESNSKNDQRPNEVRQPNSGIKVYLGPKNSGTRQLAELVMNKAKIPLSIGDDLAIDDFEEMATAIKKGEIQGGFFLGPIEGSTGTIESIAASNKCTLIDIDQAPRLSRVKPYVFADQIPAYSYSFGGPESRLDDIMTLKVRRIAVVSKNMDSGDAFRLANHVRAALPNQAAESASAASSAGFSLNYPLHPALSSGDKFVPGLAWLNRNLSWFAPLLVAMALSFASELWTEIASWLRRHDAQNSNKSVNSYESIERLLDSLYDELADAEDALFNLGTGPAENDLSAWKRQFDRIYARISDASKAKAVSRNQKDSLLERAAKLNGMLEFIRKPPIEFGVAKSGLSDAPANVTGQESQSRK